MTQQTLEEKVAIFRDMSIELAVPLEQLKKLEKDIRAEIKETGELPTVEGVTMKVVSPKKPRTKWDSAKLEGYAVANPDVLEFRTQSWASPSLYITVE